MKHARTIATALAIVAASSLALSGCSSSTPNTNNSSSSTPAATSAAVETSAAPQAVSMTFWHNATAGKGADYMTQAVTAFQNANPGVTITPQIVQNEDYDGKLQAAMQANTTPDIFFQRGGQKMADQLAAGQLGDVTNLLSSTAKSELGGNFGTETIDGKIYGVPVSLQPGGLWYSGDLFQAAGVDPASIKTMDDLNTAVTALKGTGVFPIALGAKDAWPAAHWFYWLGLRECTQTEATAMTAGTPNLDDPCWLKALQDLSDLNATNPWNDGFLTTVAQQGAGSSAGLLANHQAAMELQGAWEPGVIGDLTPDGENLPDLGFIPFPTVTGGQGGANAFMAGADGYSCSAKAPQPACADFLSFLASTDQQKLYTVAFSTIPANPNAADAVTDPATQAASAALAGSPYTLLWFDTMLGSKGDDLNTAIVALLAGQVDANGALTQIKAALS